MGSPEGIGKLDSGGVVAFSSSGFSLIWFSEICAGCVSSDDGRGGLTEMLLSFIDALTLKNKRSKAPTTKTATSTLPPGSTFTRAISYFNFQNWRNAFVLSREPVRVLPARQNTGARLIVSVLPSLFLAAKFEICRVSLLSNYCCLPSSRESR